MKTLLLILLIIFLVVLFWYSPKKPLSYEKPASESVPVSSQIDQFIDPWYDPEFPNVKG